MAFFWLAVILGINIPLSILLISKADEASGVVVPMPTCAKAREFDAECFLEVEVENLDELRQAITADVDRVLLDNFTLEQLREALEIRQELNSGCDFEASGNVDADSVVAIAETGVDYISVGGITKHIKATDLSFRIQSE